MIMVVAVGPVVRLISQFELLRAFIVVANSKAVEARVWVR